MTRSPSLNFSLIIPNYNGAQFLPSCLGSLIQAIRHCPQSQFEIILVDNGSTDQSRQIAQRYSTKLISLSKNLGFGEAINRGATVAKYDYLVVINNDLTVSPHWFEYITRSIIEYPDTACFYGLVLNKDGSRIESEGFNYFMSGKAVNINNGQPFHKSYFINHKSTFIWGAPASLIVYKKEVFGLLGGFDVSFFAYIEDVDIAYRMAKLNYKTLYIPQAISYHLGGGTSSRINYLREWLTFRNWFKLIAKNYTFKEILIYFFPIILERLRNLKYLLIKLIKL